MGFEPTNLRDLASYERCCQFLFESVCSVMKLESKTHVRPLLNVESPVALWLDHPTSLRRVVGLVSSGVRIFPSFQCIQYCNIVSLNSAKYHRNE